MEADGKVNSGFLFHIDFENESPFALIFLSTVVGSDVCVCFPLVSGVSHCNMLGCYDRSNYDVAAKLHFILNDLRYCHSTCLL